MSLVNTVALMVGTSDGTITGSQQPLKIGAGGGLSATTTAFSPLTSQTIAFTGSSSQSSAFSGSTGTVRVFCTQDCFIQFGANPTASSSTIFLPSGIVDFFSVTSTQKIAAIQSTTSGTLYITEGS